MNGTIIKALSGFYYVSAENSVYECRARGKFRLDGTSPLVAYIVVFVFISSYSNPVTDPFLIDRVSVITEEAGCELIVCINKTDIDPANELYDIYSSSGFDTFRVSAFDGSGIDELRSGKYALSQVTPASENQAY